MADDYTYTYYPGPHTHADGHFLALAILIPSFPRRNDYDSPARCSQLLLQPAGWTAVAVPGYTCRSVVSFVSRFCSRLQYRQFPTRYRAAEGYRRLLPCHGHPHYNTDVTYTIGRWHTTYTTDGWRRTVASSRLLRSTWTQTQHTHTYTLYALHCVLRFTGYYTCHTPTPTCSPAWTYGWTYRARYHGTDYHTCGYRTCYHRYDLDLRLPCLRTRLHTGLTVQYRLHLYIGSRHTPGLQVLPVTFMDSGLRFPDYGLLCLPRTEPHVPRSPPTHTFTNLRLPDCGYYVVLDVPDSPPDGFPFPIWLRTSYGWVRPGLTGQFTVTDTVGVYSTRCYVPCYTLRGPLLKVTFEPQTPPRTW